MCHLVSPDLNSMKKTPQLCFVQFMHPSKEHRPDSNGFKKWNTGAHKRKFLEVHGRCIRGDEDYNGPLHLWGEWEPESEVISTIDRPVPDGPQFIYRPFYYRPVSYTGLQNTDPFVFGAFYYSGCKQFNAKGATQLRSLERGSVVLFGSQVSRKFVIDTVFVVDRWEDHSRENFPSFESKVSNTFMDVTLKPWHWGQAEESHCHVEDNSSLRLYWGATYESPVDGMFSFFPASPTEETPNGFARPWIRIPGILNDQNRQATKLNSGSSKDEVKKYWQETRRQVESQGLWCGVSALEPGIR